MPFFVFKTLGFLKLWCESYFASLFLYTSPTLTNTNDATQMIPDFVRVLKDPGNQSTVFFLENFNISLGRHQRRYGGFLRAKWIKNSLTCPSCRETMASLSQIEWRRPCAHLLSWFKNHTLRPCKQHDEED